MLWLKGEKGKQKECYEDREWRWVFSERGGRMMGGDMELKGYASYHSNCRILFLMIRFLHQEAPCKSSRCVHNQRIRHNAHKDNTTYTPQRRPPAFSRYRKRQYSHHHYRTYRIPLLALSSLPLKPLTPAALFELLELPLRCLLASSG